MGFYKSWNTDFEYHIKIGVMKSDIRFNMV